MVLVHTSDVFRWSDALKISTCPCCVRVPELSRLRKDGLEDPDRFAGVDSSSYPHRDARALVCSPTDPVAHSRPIEDNPLEREASRVVSSHSRWEGCHALLLC